MKLESYVNMTLDCIILYAHLIYDEYLDLQYISLFIIQTKAVQ